MGTLRSLSFLLLLARGVAASIDVGVGSFGGGIAFDLPLLARAELVAAARFSLSDENDAAGDGESEATLDTRRCLRRVGSPSEYISSSSAFSSAGAESFA